MAVLRELLYPHECDNITQFLGPLLGTPPGRMKGGLGKNDWTMKKYVHKLFRVIDTLQSCVVCIDFCWAYISISFLLLG